MNPYTNHNLSELLTIISNNNFLPNTDINEVCTIAVTRISAERDAIYFVRALRKAKHFEQANEFHTKFNITYPSSQGLKSEALWLKFSSKIVDRDNRDYIYHAEIILKETDQNNQQTKLIYEVTVLLIISRLIDNQKYAEAYQWTKKLNPLILSDKGRKDVNDRYHPSHRLQFYNDKAKILIHLCKVKWYLDWVFSYANFSKQKHEEFVTQIMKLCTFNNYDGSSFLSNVTLGNYLFKIDVDLVSKISPITSKASLQNKIRLSELNQYLFCPVSYALNNTFTIGSQKPLDSSSIWKGSKDGFYDRYMQYQQVKNIKSCFEYYVPNMGINSVIKEDQLFTFFEEFFQATISVNNTLNENPRTYISDDGLLSGAPDYLLTLRTGKRVIIAEKFSNSDSAGAQKVYNSDVIDLEAYILKFKKIKIDYAYFLNWNWTSHKEQIENGPDIKTLYVNNVNIHKIDLSVAREALVNKTIGSIVTLNSGKNIKYASLGFANKCLNCSVYNYCEHKGGTDNTLSLPYGT